MRQCFRDVAVDSVPERLVQRNLAEWCVLGKQYRRDPVTRINPEQRIGGPIPEELTNRTGGFLGIGGWPDAHREIDTKTYLSLGRQKSLIDHFSGHSVG